MLRKMSIPSGIVNGRISPSSFRGYLRVKWFMGRVLKGFDFLAMQTPEDGDRIKALGAPQDRVEIMGNMKYDGSFLIPPDRVEKMRREIGLSGESVEAGKPLWVAGSTHRGEEELVLQVYEILASRFPDLKLAIAPRHPERFGEVAGVIEKHGLSYGRFSDAPNLPAGWKLLLVDTLGDLPAFYALSTVVFVGGSLVPVGGHNVIEPAAWGKPVLFGPHMFHFKDVALKMIRAGCGVQVRDVRELSLCVARWLESPEERITLGKQALKVVEENRGAVDRAVALIEKHLLPSP
jgi:3-deoxy-D-manno-octulosonic-acid transferase